MFGEVPIYSKSSRNEDFPKCPICGSTMPSQLTWTFVHGVARCRCGAEFKVYHYDSERKNVLPLEPTCLVDKELLPKYKEAWESIKTSDEKEHLQEFFILAERISEESKEHA
jgi:hypothetical protein